jgi:hypothetical protein
MILRRVIAHFRKQEWTAIFLDFLIVVVGVFVGIQVSNWNDARAFKDYERVLLRELRDETVANINDAQAKSEAFAIGAAAARRVLAISDGEAPPCNGDCWPVIVDLMHASQWQQVKNTWPTFDEMRRQGLPSNRRIIPAVEEFQLVNFQSANALASPPPYRAKVRSVLPIKLQDAYWDHCYSLTSGIERYFVPCAPPDGIAVDPAMVESILTDADLMSALREWTSIARVIGASLAPLSSTGESILAEIDNTAGSRP